MPLLDIRHQFLKGCELFGLVKMSDSLLDRRTKEKSLIDYLSVQERYYFSEFKAELSAYQTFLSSSPYSDLFSPTGYLNGNRMIYKALLASFEVDLPTKDLEKELNFYSHISHLRYPEGIDPPSHCRYKSGSNYELILKLMCLHSEIIRSQTESSSNFERAISIRQSQISEEKKIEVRNLLRPVIFGQNRVLQVGPIVYLHISGETIFLSNEHFSRYLDTLLQVRNFLLLQYQLNLPEENSVLRFVKLMLKKGVMNSERLGEGCKAARNYLVWSLSQDKLMGDSPEKLLMRTYDEWKSNLAYEILEYIDNNTCDTYGKIIFSHFYKYIPHPDSDMATCFRGTYGVQESNPVDPTALKHMKGCLRKSLFAASVKSGEPFRIISGDEHLVLESTKPSPNYQSMIGVGFERWSNVRFDVSRSHSDYLSVKSRTLDKSHCSVIGNPKISDDPHQDVGYLSGRTLPKRVMKTLFGKDMVLKYKKDAEPTPNECKEYFSKLVRDHMLHELNLGHRPNSSEIKEFYKQSPESFHWVATEGKYGETHKETTRMFYLANPYMKKYLSYVERLTKNITHGQLGNSINKTYAAREQDLRSFSHSIKNAYIRHTPVYLSFDMSEFSKRFPGENIRVLGEVLSELTGDPNLAYLDIAFRSAVVAHSTRGIESAYAGVTGGFEGFLNFGWTCLHVAIMTVALREAEVYGAVLAYSDDGVLYFLVDSSDNVETIQRVVQTIQVSYRKLGLVFHIGKTLVSTTTYEYLGEVSDEGRLLPSWVKPLASFSVVERKDSFTPTGLVIDSIIGQFSACVAAGFDPTILEPFVYYHSAKKLSRLCSKLSIYDYASLLILPRSCGGYGFCGGFNSLLSMERDPLSEFIADVQLLSRVYPKMCEKMVSYVFSNLRTDLEATMSTLMGNTISTGIPDITGLNSLISAGNKLRRQLGLNEADHPLTPIRADQIIQVLRCLTGITPGIISSIISSTPLMADYERAAQEGKSSGTYKILGRRVIKELQAKDTRLLRTVLSSFLNHNTKYSDIGLLISSVNKHLKRCGLSLPRMSARLCVRITHSLTPDIKVITDLNDYDGSGLGRRKVRSTMELPYLEPKMTSNYKSDNLSFLTENSRDHDVPYKLLKYVMSLVKEFPELSAPLQLIVGIMGYAMPVLPAAPIASVVRKRAGQMKPDITLNVPQIHKARSTLILMHSFLRDYLIGDDCDRTTIEYVSLALSSVQLSNLGIYSSPSQSKMHHTHLSVTSRDILYSVSFSLDRELPNFPLPAGLPRSVQESLIAKYEKLLMDEERVRKAIEVTSAEKSDLSVLLEYYADMLYRRTKRIISSYGEPVSLSSTLFETTSLQYNLEIYRRVIMKYMIFLEREDLQATKNTVSEYFSDYSGILPIEITDSSIISTISEEELRTYKESRAVSETFFNISKTLVIDSGMIHGIDPVTRCVKKIIENTISELYSIGFDQGWHKKFLSHDNRIKIQGSERRDGISFDCLMDMLSIGYDSSRRSTHRKTYYNSTTFNIIAYKMFVASQNLGSESPPFRIEEQNFISQHSFDPLESLVEEHWEYDRPECSDDDHEDQGDVQVSLYLSASQVKYFEDNYRRINGRDLGPDHKSILKGPLFGKSLNRTRLYVKHSSLQRKLPGPELQKIIKYSQDLQTIYNQILGDVIVRSIVVLDRRSVSSDFCGSGKYIASLPPAPSPGTYTRSRESSESETSYYIMWANLLLLMQSEAIEFIKFDSNFPAGVINTKLSRINTSTNGVNCTYKNPKRDSLMLVNEVFQDPVSAVSALSNIGTLGQSKLSAIMLGGNYIIVGAILISKKTVKASAPNSSYIRREHSLAVFPPNPEEHLNLLLANTGSYIHKRLFESPKFTRVTVSGTTIRLIGRPARVLRVCPLLVAAGVLCSSASRYNQVLWAWYLLQAHFTGGGLRRALELYNMDRDAYGNPRIRQHMITSLKSSVQSIKTYFTLNPISGSIDLDLSEYLEVPPQFVIGFENEIRTITLHKETMTLDQVVALEGTVDDGMDIIEMMFPINPVIGQLSNLLQNNSSNDERKNHYQLEF